ncbi:MAG: hypothetical protein U0V64_02475 [Cyclobacteriaceae bacterium]
MFTLRLKHWMLFLLMIGPPLIASVIAEPNPVAWPRIAGNIYATIVYFLWLGSLARRVLDWRRPDTWFFWISIIFSFLAFVLVNLYLLTELTRFDFTYMGVGVIAMQFIALLILARELEYRLISGQKRRQTFLFDAMLMLIFPIGIWWLQPRVNTLVNDR